MKKPKERAKMAELLVLLLLSYLLSIGARPYAVPDDNEILGCACVRYVPGSIELLYLSYEHWNWVGVSVGLSLIVGLCEGPAVGTWVGLVGTGEGIFDGESDGFSVGRLVGNDVGTIEGSGLGLRVGSIVGFGVGGNVGSGLGSSVGPSVGSGVGIKVGRAVGKLVGGNVGSRVGIGTGM